MGYEHYADFMHSYEWEKIRERIYRREAGKCQHCHFATKRAGRSHQVHHLNHNWRDNRDSNLLLLCHYCHTREIYGWEALWKQAHNLCTKIPLAVHWTRMAPRG